MRDSEVSSELEQVSTTLAVRTDNMKVTVAVAPKSCRHSRRLQRTITDAPQQVRSSQKQQFRALTQTPLIPQEDHFKWYVKFGDGDGETPARYAVHNPEYNIQTNTTGRAGKERQDVFAARGFTNPSQPGPFDKRSHSPWHCPDPTGSEWYTLWERPILAPPIVLADRLVQALDAFANYNLGTAAGITAAVTNLNTRIPWPAACANPPP